MTGHASRMKEIHRDFSLKYILKNVHLEYLGSERRKLV
jgi:hypothetical protein